MDHFDEMGIDALHLTPMYESPLLDMGFDISNFYDVDSRYGTMADFEKLISEMKKRGEIAVFHIHKYTYLV